METHISDIIHVIQLAVAPVFLAQRGGASRRCEFVSSYFFGCTASKD